MNLNWTLCLVLKAAVRGGNEDTCLLKLCLGTTCENVIELILDSDMFYLILKLISNSALVLEVFCSWFLTIKFFECKR